MFSFVKRWFLTWLGVNPDLPFTDEVPNPYHGQFAKNREHHQKVAWDKYQEKWVMPQNLTGKPPVTIK